MGSNNSLLEEDARSESLLYGGVDEAKARAQIERILRSESFRTSVRMSRFLRYVSEAALDGRFEEIKETCIVVAAYDRDPSYDPKTDTVVRSEARRLRRKLDEYYTTEGKGDSVIIALPKGAYVPSFASLGGQEQASAREPEIPSTVASLPSTPSTETSSSLASLEESPLREHRVFPNWTINVVLCVLLAVAVGLLVFLHGRRSQSLVATKVLPLTSLTGQVFQPAVSPDGINTAFIWNRGDSNYSVYVIEPQGNPLRLTTSTMDDLHPSWSPDGRSLAFLRVTSEEADVMTIPVPGGMERKRFSLKSARPWGDDQLGARNDTGPTWSSDGQSLLVSDTAPSGHGLAIFSNSLDGSNSKPLSFPESEDRDLSPTPSPDGRWIAFVRFTSYDSADLYMVPTGGGDVRRLTSEHMDIQGLAWMPGSHQLLFSSNRTGIYALWTLNIEGGPPTPVAIGGEAAIQPSISRDGNVIVYADASFPSSVIKASLSKRGGFTQTSVISSPNSQNNSAQFSSDGKKLVFASNRTGSWELWTASAEGDNLTRLTDFNSSLVGSPRWSPDGRSIVFSARPDVHAAVSIISAGGGKSRILSSREYEEKRPGWLTDSKWVFFTSDRGGKMRLWKTRVAGGSPLLVSQEPRFDVQPSDDGHLYFTSENQGLWQMNPDGGSTSVVQGLEQKRFGRMWTVTANGIYFIDIDSDRRALQRYDLNTHQISLVGVLPSEPLIGYPSLSVSPVDSSVLFSGKENTRSNLMIFRRSSTDQTK